MDPADQMTIRPIERSIELLDRVDYRLAETEAEKEAIYRLRYRAYMTRAPSSRAPIERLTDRFDDLPNSWIFGVYIDGELDEFPSHQCGDA